MEPQKKSEGRKPLTSAARVPLDTRGISQAAKKRGEVHATRTKEKEKSRWSIVRTHRACDEEKPCRDDEGQPYQGKKEPLVLLSPCAPEPVHRHRRPVNPLIEEKGNPSCAAKKRKKLGEGEHPTVATTATREDLLIRERFKENHLRKAS